jgi:hypothetical protein
MFTKQDIEKYFLAEKQMGILFIIIGSVAVVIAICFLFLLKTSFYKGAAVPLLVIGLIQLASSVVIYSKSDKHRIRIVYAHDMNPGQLKNEELPRMKKIIKNFASFKWIETALVITGLALIFYFRNNEQNAFWYGLGVTLSVMIIITFIADYAAERRAILYSNGIQSTVNSR